MAKVVILGGHGDGLVALQIIRDMNKSGQGIECVGFLNDGLSKGEAIEGIPVLGKTCEWSSLATDVFFHVSLHKVGQMRARKALIESFAIPDERLVSLVHPTAVIADGIDIGPGSLIASCVTVQPHAHIGRFATIRAGANIGHDASVGDFAYVGPNATLCGRSRLECAAHLGPNGVLVDAICAGEFSVIGAGAVAMREIDAGSTWMGNPARRVK